MLPGDDAFGGRGFGDAQGVFGEQIEQRIGFAAAAVSSTKVAMRPRKAGTDFSSWLAARRRFRLRSGSTSSNTIAATTAANSNVRALMTLPSEKANWLAMKTADEGDRRAR